MGGTCIVMFVKDIMKRPVVVDRKTSLEEAAKIMKERKIGSLLAYLKNKSIGIVTEGDLTRNFGKHEEISQIMKPKAITIEADERVEGAVEIMKENKIKRLPVTDKGELVGIITSSEIIANFEDLEEDFIFD